MKKLFFWISCWSCHNPVGGGVRRGCRPNGIRAGAAREAVGGVFPGARIADGKTSRQEPRHLLDGASLSDARLIA